MYAVRDQFDDALKALWLERKKAYEEKRCKRVFTSYAAAHKQEEKKRERCAKPVSSSAEPQQSSPKRCKDSSVTDEDDEEVLPTGLRNYRTPRYSIPTQVTEEPQIDVVGNDDGYDMYCLGIMAFQNGYLRPVLKELVIDGKVKSYYTVACVWCDSEPDIQEHLYYSKKCTFDGQPAYHFFCEVCLLTMDEFFAPPMECFSNPVCVPFTKKDVGKAEYPPNVKEYWRVIDDRYNRLECRNKRKDDGYPHPQKPLYHEMAKTMKMADKAEIQEKLKKRSRMAVNIVVTPEQREKEAAFWREEIFELTGKFPQSYIEMFTSEKLHQQKKRISDGIQRAKAGEPKIYFCLICQIDIKSRSLYESHMRRLHRNKYPCKEIWKDFVCDFNAESVKKLILHRKSGKCPIIYDAEEKWKLKNCKWCKKASRTKEANWAHLRLCLARPDNGNDHGIAE